MLIAWLVGFYAAVPPEHFDWNVAAAAGTAAGTLALAVVTGILAVLTNDDVQLTRGIETERHRPTLVVSSRAIVDVTRGEGGTRLAGTLQVVLENVGMGPAINVYVEATYPSDQVHVGHYDRLYAIAPGRTNAAVANIEFTATSETEQRAPEPNALAFRLSVRCRDRTLAAVDSPLVTPEYVIPE